MPFFINRIAADNEATKAVFEHVRNLATSAAVGAAGVWLIKQGSYSTFRGIVSGVAAVLLWMTSLWLMQLAVTNAGNRLKKAGSWNVWINLVWTLYVCVLVSGLYGFAMKT
ncbi:hypothetical protein [Caballeronia novacaledonica]|uniref:Uncharacterized protein n=1 Tax=Caballeronia novacaledonica TaxID=1544861 RepID=A0AA37IK71_9BURK|nr:hypothetical protein [Caballeronia novacaledonica]GJH30234.1 hypothetical protein CBA19CS42_36980 [Caballeronia novacaledonica]